MPDAPTLLLIEDDLLMRLTLSSYLEDSGFRCLEAADGVEGLELFARCRPDLVVTDLRMPRLDGLGVLLALQASSPDTPVILLSGAGDEALARQARLQGARACLAKPLVELELLVSTIAAILNPAHFQQEQV